MRFRTFLAEWNILEWGRTRARMQHDKFLEGIQRDRSLPERQQCYKELVQIRDEEGLLGEGEGFEYLPHKRHIY